ncbi:MAG TPA: PAS domain S-box protein [Balneolales bacterium]|nr:PAS domain S-box protein [Balneolales bacterium]
MAAGIIHILLVDDDHEDYLITRSRLQQIKDQEYELEWVDGFDNGFDRIMEGEHDIYLLDYRLGAQNGLELMQRVIQAGCEAPLILLTGQGDREIDLKAMRYGAADYLVKSELQAPLLERSIRYAIERKKSQEALRESEERYRDLFENANDMIQSVAEDGHFLYVNATWKRIMGYDQDGIDSLNLIEVIHPDERITFTDSYNHIITGEGDDLIETAFITKDGRKIFVQGSVNCKFKDGDFISTRSIFRDITERKIAERERDRLYELSHDLIAIVDFQLRFIDVNPSWNRMLGYNISELRHMNLLDLIHPEDIPAARYQIDLLKNGETVAPFEVRFRCIDNTYKWLSCSFSAEGKDQILYLFARDITEVKKSQIELLDSERRYRELVENSYGVIFTHDLNGKILSANRAFSKLVGYEIDEIVGFNLSSFILSEELPQFYRYLEKISRQQQATGSATMMRKNGEPIYIVFSNFLYHPQHGNSYVIANAHDITDRVRAEKALESERQQLLKVIANAPVPMALMDKDLNFITYSKKWIEEFPPDYSEQIVGENYQKMYSFIPDTWIQAGKEALKGKVVSKQEDVVEIPLVGKRYFRWAIHPWSNPDGQVEGIVAVIDRIDDLVKARVEAQQASQAKSAFLANITHELRTPLNAILGYAQILSNDPTMGDSQQEYIRNMYNSAMHLTSMINDILDLSKIEAGKMDINMEPANLAAIMDEVNGLFNLKSREKGIRLIIEKDKNLPVLLKMDAGKIRQILINLVGNAVKFTTEGSIHAQARLLDISQSGWAKIHLSVKDTGRGIPDDQIRKIFEPFRQVKGMNSEGTGLGLTITQHLIRMMKGDLQVESNLNDGSTFSITFNFELIKPENALTPGEPKFVKSVKGKKKWKAVIADTIDYQRKMLRIMLEKAGFECTEVFSVDDLLEKVQKSKPDIIFIDQTLEDDNIKGLQQSIDELRRPDSEVAVIIIKDATPGFERQQALHGVVSVQRPYQEEEIFEAIKKSVNIDYVYSFISPEESVSLNEILDQAVQEIAALPANLQEDLIEALEFQDLDKIDQLADMLEGQDTLAGLSEKLKKAVNSSDYYLITHLGKRLLQDVRK